MSDFPGLFCPLTLEEAEAAFLLAYAPDGISWTHAEQATKQFQVAGDVKEVHVVGEPTDDEYRYLVKAEIHAEARRRRKDRIEVIKDRITDDITDEHLSAIETALGALVIPSEDS